MNHLCKRIEAMREDFLQESKKKQFPNGSQDLVDHKRMGPKPFIQI